MKITHAAVWTQNSEQLRDFYCFWFGGIAGAKYQSKTKDFQSYFVRFESGPALEIMSRSQGLVNQREEALTGYAHLAFSTENREAVENLTRRMQEAGVVVVSGPRTTGDGYYESCVLDPDGNRVEITC